MHRDFVPVTLLHSEEDISDWFINNQDVLERNYVRAVRKNWGIPNMRGVELEFKLTFVNLCIEHTETTPRFFYGTLTLAWAAPSHVDASVLRAAFEQGPLTVNRIENFTHRAGINALTLRMRMLRSRFHRLNTLIMLSQ